jgi:hypothetical protein
VASKRASTTSPGGPIAECTSAGLRGVTSASQRFARWRPLKLGHRLSPDMLQQLTAGRDDYQSVESTAARAFAGTKNSRRASTLGDRTAVDHRCSGGERRASHRIPRERWGPNAPGYPGFRRPFSRVITMPEVGGIFPANPQAQTRQPLMPPLVTGMPGRAHYVRCAAPGYVSALYEAAGLREVAEWNVEVELAT